MIKNTESRKWTAVQQNIKTSKQNKTVYCWKHHLLKTPPVSNSYLSYSAGVAIWTCYQKRETNRTVL